MKFKLMSASLAVAAVALVSGCSTTGGSDMSAGPARVVVEAETFTKETGGTISLKTGRPATSANVCISSWDNAGHDIQWKVKVPKAGKYAVALRFAGGRGWNVYRNLSISGATLPAEFAKIAFTPTGGWGTKAEQWKNIVVSDKAGKPIFVSLPAGEHTVTMKNIGGDGENGSGNLDVFALYEAGAEVDLTPKK